MKFRFAHNNFNVLDLERSLKFYKEALGFEESRRLNAPDFTLVYLSDGGQTPHELELTWLHDRKKPYDLGENEFHLAVTADDFDAAAINRVARSIHRLGGTYDSMMDSLKKTIGGRGESWKSLTPVQREMYRTVLRGFKSNPYNDRALEERMEAVRESVTKPMDY